ncbi:Do family serine endopeptidase [Falsiroseomonas sp.]|uniref:Do family serine endopeptidase n=1 Tax=Falsiroseomonas sp. TaxID=2870721 RepID=UPI0035616C52
MSAVPHVCRAGLLALGLLGGTALTTPALAQQQGQNQNLQAQITAPNFAALVERVAPAVVRVTVQGAAPQMEAMEIPPELRGTPLEEFFRRFGGGQGGPRGGQPRRAMGQGSGFIIGAEGFVVTNNHVVGEASRVTVELADGRELQARVIGGDPLTDIALLKVDAGGNLPTVSWGDSEALRVGEPVLAMGNPFGLGGTATSGIVSARGRQIGAGPYDDFIQTDASINPGNSGGPLFNVNGQVVGVNTAIFSPSGGNIGIGFAVPSRLAQRVVEDLRDDGKVSRGWLGVSLQPVDQELAQALGLQDQRGALVASVEPGSPAARAGLRAGDLVTRAGERQVQNPRDLAAAVAETDPGSQLALTLRRDGQQQQQQVTLGTAPDRRADAGGRGGAQGGSATGPLGLALAPRPGGQQGAAVTRVAPGSVAAERGLQEGDVILRAGDRDVANPGDVSAAIQAARQAGRPAVALQIQRGDQRSFVALPLTGQQG